MNQGALAQQVSPKTIADSRSQWIEVTSLWHSQPWVADARRTIARVSALGDDWDGEGSPAPRPSALEVMNRLIKEIDSFELTQAHIGPVSGGGIGVEWRCGDRDLTIEILPDGSLEFLKAEKTSSGFNLNEMVGGKIRSDRLNEVRGLIRWLISS
jgi:hypothetical protein